MIKRAWRYLFGSTRRQVSARYDSAATNTYNADHWSQADSLSVDAAMSQDVRQILRNRSRYEVANNGYARGIGETLTNDVIGSGPRLQMLTENREVNTLVETLWNEWAREINLPGLLRQMRYARYESGECFAVMGFDDALESRVKLGLRLYEADHVTAPYRKQWDETDPSRYQDGITYDDAGRPTFYDILQEHPGSMKLAGTLGLADTFAPERVIHDFRPSRPGQLRGIPELTPVLDLFAQLRRYTKATLTAAETAAMIALYMKTTMPSVEAAEVNIKETWKLKPGEAVFVPEGWEPSQLKAEQPTNTYQQFKRELLNEMARPLSMPYNVASCDSSGYNFASGQLDHLTYDRFVQVDRQHVEIITADRLLREFIRVGQMLGVIPALEVRPLHGWMWRGRPHANPVDDANAAHTRVSTGLGTLAEEFARKGLDWEEQLQQMAREKAISEKLGLSATQAGDVALTALNGAQVTSLVQVLSMVAMGQLPGDSAIEIIKVSFPNVDDAMARAMVTPASNFEPRPPEAPAPAPGSPGSEPDTDPETETPEPDDEDADAANAA